VPAVRRADGRRQRNGVGSSEQSGEGAHERIPVFLKFLCGVLVVVNWDRCVVTGQCGVDVAQWTKNRQFANCHFVR
jgi:hypothetical protein